MCSFQHQLVPGWHHPLLCVWGERQSAVAFLLVGAELAAGCVCEWESSGLPELVFLGLQGRGVFRLQTLRGESEICICVFVSIWPRLEGSVSPQSETSACGRNLWLCK